MAITLNIGDPRRWQHRFAAIEVKYSNLVERGGDAIPVEVAKIGDCTPYSVLRAYTDGKQYAWCTVCEKSVPWVKVKPEIIQVESEIIMIDDAPQWGTPPADKVKGRVRFQWPWSK